MKKNIQEKSMKVIFKLIYIKYIITDFLRGCESIDDDTAVKLFDELCRNNPRTAYEFSKENEEQIENTPVLKGIRDKH